MKLYAWSDLQWRLVVPGVYWHDRQGESNDTMSTSYGDVEPIGSVAKSQPEPAQTSYTPHDDNTGVSDRDREEASQAVQEVKEDITAPTGDIDQDLEQLNVEVTA